MEKRTLDQSAFIQSDNVITLQTGKDALRVRKSISYEKKEQFAFALAQSTIVIDSETGICYSSYRMEMMKAFLFAKYYTDIDVDELDNEDGHKAVCDYLMRSGLLAEAYKEAKSD